ncbi:MAG TPA: rhomboid family intramembrane serine protease [Terriglobales bacterium]|nr:rhomboid family intramembrane serine protease [Terriglobales bacterium]
MRPPPSLSEIPRYPVIAGTALLAVGVTVAWWMKIDISPLFETALIRRGELLRLVTSIFPHLGILHLVFNIYWLWIFGVRVEETLGHLRTAVLILLFAIGSGAWEFALASGGVGLSGVVYGLFGLIWMLSRYDERFKDAIDARTVQLFVGWFLFCVVATYTKIMLVGNIAHGAGAVLGILTGLAIAKPDNRALFTAGLAATFLLGLWGATMGRPRVNLSGNGGYEEAKWGYDALMAHKNEEAVRWFRDAVTYQPRVPGLWYYLAYAYQRAGNHDQAFANYRKAAELGDANAQYYLALQYERGDNGLTKDAAKALYWYRKLADQGDANSLNNVAWAYATSDEPSIRNSGAALELARKAISLQKDHPNPNYLDTLAEAFYVNNQPDEAARTELEAIALSSPTRRNDFEKRLEKYQQARKAGQPHQQ